LQPQLLIGVLITSADLAQFLVPLPETEPYQLLKFNDPEDFLNWVRSHWQQIDCLILELSPVVAEIIPLFHQSGILLPAIILVSEPQWSPSPKGNSSDSNVGNLGANLSDPPFYHPAEIRFLSHNLLEVFKTINLAMSRFLELATNFQSGKQSPEDPFPIHQQLVNKLRERLGYLGIYYKRDPQFFLRHQSKEERDLTIDQFRSLYRYIVLNYFSPPPELNEKIDEFVNLAFFTDIPVTHIVEIHMELMDGFAKQLKLEGRSDEILLDYRLTLIDIIAHLCEMYRRSIPRDC